MGATYTRQSSYTDGDTITAAHTNDEFNQLLAAFQLADGHSHDGTANEGGKVTKLLGTSITIGDGTSATDITVTFDGETSDGVLTWMEDEDYFKFSDDIMLVDDEQLIFGSDSNIAISYDETTTDSLKIAATEGAGLAITLMADEGDDAGDEWKLNIADGGTLTLGNDIASAGSYVTHLTLTPNSTVASSTLAVAGNLTVGGSLTLGSGAELAEAELEMLDGITAGTVAASKAMVVDANKDIGTVRNLTIDGTFSDGNYTFDTSGNVTGLGTIASGAITSSGIVTGTGFTAGSAVLAEAELELLDGLTAGTAIASKVVTTDSNIDTTGQRNLTISGELDAATLDISGNADIDGTTNLDAVDIDGAVQIDATVTIGANDQGYDIIFYGDTASANMTWDTSADDLIFNGAAGLIIPDGQLTLGSTAVSSTAAELNLLDGVSGLVQADFTKLAAVDSTAAELNIVDAGTSATSTTVVDADRVVFNDADAGMVQVAVTDLAAYFDDEITAMPNLTSVGTLTTLTVDNVIINGTTIGHTDDTDLMTLADGVLTVAGELDATTLDISGNADIDGTLEADAYTVDGTALNEYIADTVGAMVTSNTESGITVAYQDADNTLDFTVGTLNQDTTGTASLAVVTDSTANTNFPVVFHNESNGLLDDTGALRYNPSTGTLLVPNLSVAGTTTTVDTVTMQAANAVIFEGATADAHETTLSIVDPTGDHTQYLINQGGYIPVLAAATTTAITSTPAELNILDGKSFVDEDDMSSDSATAIASQQSIKAYVDNNAGSMSNFYLEDGDGTEVTINNGKEVKFVEGGGVDINWTDTSTGSDGDPYDLTFTINAAQTDITSIYATDLIIGEDAQTAIDFGTVNEIDFKVDNAARLTLTASALYPVTDNQIDLGTSSLEFKDAFFDGTVTADAFAGPLTGDVTGNVSGTAATVTTAAQSNITSLGTLTTLTVDNVIINGSTIGHTGDTDLMTVASGVLTVAGEVDATSLDISGDADIDGTLEADAITVGGTALNTVIAGVTVTDATNSAHVLVTDNESTDEENLITFVEGATSSTGNVGLEMDGHLAYNPSTGTVTATIFKGNIDAVDGDFDGTLEADAITIGGTAIGSIYGVVAGSSSIVTTGALDAGSITSNFGAINNGASAITTTGIITGGTLEATTDTAAGDNAAIGYTSGEGLILTGQGSTSDVTIKNDADADVLSIATGTTILTVSDDVNVVGRATGTVTTDNDGNFDLQVSNQWKCTPSGNFTLTFSNPAVGQSGSVMLINSGGHTVSAHASVAINATTLTALTTAGTYMLSYYCSAASGNNTILVSASGVLT